MQLTNRISFGAGALAAIILGSFVAAAEGQTEWERTLAEAKKEGAPVVGIPASSELRKAIATRFKEKFAIDIELFPTGRFPWWQL